MTAAGGVCVPVITAVGTSRGGTFVGFDWPPGRCERFGWPC